MTTAAAVVASDRFPAAAEPPAQTDQLAASVLRSLSRSYANQFSIGPGRAAIVGGLTFGLFPILHLRRQFSAYMTFEKQQLWHLAEWARTRCGGEESAALADYTREMRRRSRPWLTTLITLSLVGALLPMALALSDDFSLETLVDRTYAVRNLSEPWERPEIFVPFLAWNGGLLVAYALHALRVRLYSKDVAFFAHRFNAVAAREGATPIELPRGGTPLYPGFTISWIIGALVLTLLGGLWGFPMALAAAQQRRYINHAAARVRAELVARVQTMLEMRRPAVAVPSYVIHDRRCDNALCRASLRAGGRFCHRCGTAVADVTGAVA